MYNGWSRGRERERPRNQRITKINMAENTRTQETIKPAMTACERPLWSGSEEPVEDEREEDEGSE